jgi:hypothetical protein
LLRCRKMLTYRNVGEFIPNLFGGLFHRSRALVSNKNPRFRRDTKYWGYNRSDLVIYTNVVRNRPVTGSTRTIRRGGTDCGKIRSTRQGHDKAGSLKLPQPRGKT